MKKNTIITAMLFGTLYLPVMGCSTGKQNETSEKISPEAKVIEAKGTDQPTVTKEAIFRQGKLIEVAYLSVKEGKQKQLNEEYFANIMPIAGEYGMKPLMTIAVKHAWSDEIKPQMVGFFEWPSVEKREAFDKDKRFKKLKKIRDDALSYLKIGYFEVAKDAKVNLDSKLFYEVYAMTLNEKNGHLMSTYFEKAGPIVTNDYGVDFALNLSPVQMKGKNFFVPQMFGLAIWKSEADNQKFFGSSQYNEIKHYKERALQRIDVWQGAVILQ